MAASRARARALPSPPRVDRMPYFWNRKPMRVLLHVCCGPCSITVARELLDQGAEIEGLYYNPNIHPLAEYARRRDGALEVAARLGFPLTVLDAEYDPRVFFRAVNGREDARCGACYGLRLGRTAALARERGFDAFSSTLLYSKYQQHDDIADQGAALAGDGLEFLYRDFRSGWGEGIRISKEWGIYRQQWCGCLYSENERYAKLLKP